MGAATGNHKRATKDDASAHQVKGARTLCGLVVQGPKVPLQGHGLDPAGGTKVPKADRMTKI